MHLRPGLPQRHWSPKLIVDARMSPALLTSVLVMAAAAAPSISSAASTAQSNQADLDGSGQRRPTVTAPLSLMNLSPTKALVRPYDEVGIEPRQDKLPTEVDYKPFANGPVGALGVICRPISHALNSTPVGATSEGQPGSESQTLGANLAYVFR
jgi:hypothetical protein